MMFVVAVFFAKLLSPVLAFFSIAGGVNFTRWWQLVLTVLFAAAIDEAALVALRGARRFDPENFLIALTAATVWTVAAFAIGRARRRSKSRNPGTPSA